MEGGDDHSSHRTLSLPGTGVGEDLVGRLAEWRARAKQLKADVYALYLAVWHPRVPWYAKALAFAVAAYAFSPIDLIPDFVPVLGYLDDLVIVPLGIALVVRLIPRSVWAECLTRARTESPARSRAGWGAAAIIIVLWLLAITWVLQQFALQSVIARILGLP
jgi:uncharacterized membrane protein YkvA (DUF1232 family)